VARTVRVAPYRQRAVVIDAQRSAGDAGIRIAHAMRVSTRQQHEVAYCELQRRAAVGLEHALTREHEMEWCLADRYAVVIDGERASHLAAQIEAALQAG